MREMEEYPVEVSASERVIGKIDTGIAGPTVIFMGGLHGNEPSGIIALNRVLDALNSKPLPLRGRMLALSGNLAALQANKRFIDQDLNRAWTDENVERAQSLPPGLGSDDIDTHELLEIRDICKELDEVTKVGTEPVYFLDLHTTSANTIPFVATRDAGPVREFCSGFPIPVVMGIETALKGTLLERFNENGNLGLAFEAGQHDNPVSIDLHEAFIWTSLVMTGCIDRNDLPDFSQYLEKLNSLAPGQQQWYRICFKHGLSGHEQFRMRPGFENFQQIEEGLELAEDQSGVIQAPCAGRIFMPLYQDQGEDGFFIVCDAQ